MPDDPRTPDPLAGRAASYLSLSGQIDRMESRLEDRLDERMTSLERLVREWRDEDRSTARRLEARIEEHAKELRVLQDFRLQVRTVMAPLTIALSAAAGVLGTFLANAFLRGGPPPGP